MSKHYKPISQKEVCFLIGNGPNRLEHGEHSWDGVMQKLEQSCSGNAQWEPSEQVPFSFRMERLLNIDANESTQKVSNEAAANEWFEALRKLEAGEIHQLLAPIIAGNYVLTTNYDYVLDSCVRGQKRQDKRKIQCKFEKLKNAGGAPVTRVPKKGGDILHIHGTVDKPNEIIMGYSSYSRAVSKLRELAEQHVKTWVDTFVDSEVHIIGFSLRYEEQLIWYAIQQKYFRESPHRTFYYDFVPVDAKKIISEGENKKYAPNYSSDLKGILQSYNVEYVEIPVLRDEINNAYDYSSSWHHLIGELTFRQKWDYQDNAYKKFPVFQLYRVRTNISTSSSPFNGYNSYCYVNLPAYIIKKDEISEKKWFFDVLMFGVRYIYAVKIADLRNMITDNDSDYLNVFLEYKLGKISKNLDAKGITLSKIEDFSEYNNSIFHWDVNRKIINK